MSKRLNRDDIDKLHDYGLYLPTRTVYMGSEAFEVDGGESGTDGLMAERTIKNLHVLDTLNQDPITIIANNIGGDEYHGYAIYGAIRACKSHVTMIVRGHAMSMGSIILQAADERIMDPFSRMMIHYGTWGADGHALTVLKQMKEGDFQNKQMEQIYIERMRQKDPTYPLSKLKKMCEHDTYLSAADAVALGLADKVEGEE